MNRQKFSSSPLSLLRSWLLFERERNEKRKKEEREREKERTKERERKKERKRERTKERAGRKESAFEVCSSFLVDLVD